MTGDRRLRRRCEARLRSLDIPDPYDVETFVARLAEQRGRPLRLVPLPQGAGYDTPCGMWVTTRLEDWIMVEAGTSPLHREQIILHEVAHMLCGHVGGEPGAAPALPSLPDLDDALVRFVLGRASYATEQEREAELLATLILARVRRAAPPHAVALGDSLGDGAAPGLAAALSRVAQTLGPARERDRG